MRLPFLLEVVMTKVRTVLALLLLLASTAAAYARTSTGDERKLATAISQLDRTANSPVGEQAAAAGLAKAFKIPVDRIREFRARPLGFGEIAGMLAMASDLEGGLNEANVRKVADLRQGNAGWVQIARVYNIDLGPVSRKVGALERDVRDQVRRATGKRPNGAGGGGGPGPDNARDGDR